MKYRAGSLRHTMPGFGAEAALGLFHPSMKRLARRRVNAKIRALEALTDEGDGDGGVVGGSVDWLYCTNACASEFGSCLQAYPGCRQDCLTTFALQGAEILGEYAAGAASCLAFGPFAPVCIAAVAAAAAAAMFRAERQAELCLGNCETAFQGCILDNGWCEMSCDQLFP